MKSRGERLKERRLALGLTMMQVAEKVGLSTSGVQNLERGDAMPSLEIGIKLAGLYKRSVNWVIDGSHIHATYTPIVGTTNTGPDADWESPGYESRFGWISLVSEADRIFCLQISDSSPSARYAPGDVLVLSSADPFAGGGDIFVSLSDGTFEFGSLLQQSPQRLVFEELKERKRRTYEQNKINNVWKIIGSVNVNFIINTVDE